MPDRSLGATVTRLGGRLIPLYGGPVGGMRILVAGPPPLFLGLKRHPDDEQGANYTWGVDPEFGTTGYHWRQHVPPSAE